LKTFLRFSRRDYFTLSALCRPLNLERCTPNILRQVLVRGLSKTRPDLAKRISTFSGREMRIIQDHLREQHAPSVPSCLTSEEMSLLTEAFGSLLFTIRVVRPLQSALVDHFQAVYPELAGKLEQLAPRQFEELCAEIQRKTRRAPE
jgi:hypothetical protein